MRKRLVFAALCMLAVPPLFSPSQNDQLISSAPFATVALAGHTIAGSWCECGAPGCICDPGEEPGGQSAKPVSDKANGSLNQGATPRRGAFSGLDFGSGALMLALAFFLWARLRA
ncbi:MAG: hypothetical protein AABN33_10490 [Acidobacteriota bacterium]